MPARRLHAFSQEMVELLMQLLRGVTRRETHALARGDLSLPQFLVLEALTQQPRLTMQQLARWAAVTKGAMTGAVDRLAHKGLVARRRDVRDRRVVWVALTPKARGVVHDVKRQRRQTIRVMFRRVRPRDRETYLAIFRQVCASMSQEAASGR